MGKIRCGETEHERAGLKPCVFCKARGAVLVVQQIEGVPEADDVCFVRCKHCYAQGPASDGERKAVGLWNRVWGDGPAPESPLPRGPFERPAPTPTMKV